MIFLSDITSGRRQFDEVCSDEHAHSFGLRGRPSVTKAGKSVTRKQIYCRVHERERRSAINVSDTLGRVGAKRHPSITQLLTFFEYKHLPHRLQSVSQQFSSVAHRMVDGNPDSPELTAGLRKLLEAKDCFVRASLSQQ